ncbi:SusC/RagA family TonB-linked outer membrane protein [Rufibacter aurantiacus]|uniref:SusC/RagA family TonB-linked outer membrane protein n=1 Tax=Rufibacter aurantiacus TaxID=2817374 RepID=UPI001B3150E9|nr:SusC/RagA family TonB-linked outer membrane protein [Rufibacter aurantiacus]
MKKCLLLTLLVLACFMSQVWAQAVTVSGTVTSADDGTPLPGVSVVVKGTQVGTSTGVTGTYSLTVPDQNATLVFSFIGYKALERAVSGATTINVALVSDATQLTEVVVTALGVERSRNSLPYAATQLEGNTVTAARNPNMVNSLSGKVAGLAVTQTNTMGGSANVVIRGTKSLTGNNQALFVVDGVPISNDVSNTLDQSTGRGGFDYGNPASDINPDDIESMSVLKGAAATALYGSRAANGVILITTKKGKRGLGVTLNSGLTVGTIDKKTFPEYQKEYGAGYVMRWSRFDVNGDGTLDNVVRMGDDASYGYPFDPNLLVYQWDAFDPASPNYQKPRPWVAAENGPEYFFETAVSYNNSIIIDGGNEKANFKLGYTRNEDKGILPNSEISKNMINFAGSLNLTSKLSASAGVNFTQQEGLGRYGSGYNSINPMLGFRQWFQTNVDLKEQEEAYFRNRQNITWNWRSPSNLTAAYHDNVYWTRYENFQNDERYRTFGNIASNYKFTEWLDLTARFSLDTYDELQEERFAIGSTTNDQDPNYTRFNRTFREFNFDLFANFDRNFTEAFNIRGLVGLNLRRSRLNSIRASTSGGLVVPRLYALSNSLNLLQPPLESELRRAVDGIFANATLGYREMVFLDLSARRDQSSTLPRGNNSYFYPSVALSFVFSEVLKQDWLSYAKLRANYAEVGNDAPFAATNKYYNKQDEEIDEPIGTFGGIPLYSVPNTRYNPDLKPERTKSSEIGLETAFLDNRLGFEVTVYKSNTINQILPVSVSASTGYTFKYVNAGEVENRGVEAALRFQPIKNDVFSWNLNLNWTHNRNEVVALAEGENMILANYQSGITSNAAVGRPFGILRGQGFVLHENGGRIVDENGAYMLSDPTKEIANPNPDWLGGISNTFSFKGLSLYFLIDIRKGGELFNLDTYYGFGTGLYPETAGLNDLGNPSRLPISEGGGIILPGVKEDGSPNDIRVENTEGVLGYYTPNEFHVYGAGFVKLREASLTYTLPQRLISRLKVFKGIDVSVVGRNLWIIDKDVPYSDPEAGFGAGNLGQGYLSGAYPTPRNIGFNLRFQF